jgi:hypothetical protein
MPTVPVYRTRPGDRLEVEVVQPDCGRALVIGKLDAVPEAPAGWRCVSGCVTVRCGCCRRLG